MPETTLPSMQDARDAEDARLLAAGEYARLLESYYGVILKRSRARTHSEGDAYDVASEVVVRLLDELKRGRRYPVPFRVVVHQIIRWKLAEHFGRRSDAELEDEATEDAAYREAEERADIMRLLQGLAARERDVAALRILTGLPAEQIATTLGISRNNVDQAWHRAKAKLRHQLEAT